MSESGPKEQVNTPNRFFSALLVLAAIIQLFVVGAYALSWGKQITEMLALTPIEKSAYTTWTAGFSEYIRFLHEVIPEDARV